MLLAVFRRAERALVPLVPIALATGWSALVLFATRVPLNPMSATLGALVIAISTEFAVLLSERFRQERARPATTSTQALARTYRSTGRAVLASGVTAIAGFGVLAVSDFRMLRDFGIVTVVDLTVSLLGVLSCCRRCSCSPSAACCCGASRGCGAGRGAAARGRGRAAPGRVSGRDGRGPAWIAIAAGLAILAYITFNTLRRRAPARAGSPPATQLPPFAAPLVTSDLVGDANVATRADQGAAGAKPACAVTDPRALNSCALARRGPVVLAFFTDGAERCAGALDAMQRIAPRTRDVALRRGRDPRRPRRRCATLVREHGWRFPVAAGPRRRRRQLYGVAVCPTIVLAYRAAS